MYFSHKIKCYIKRKDKYLSRKRNYSTVNLHLTQWLLQWDTRRSSAHFLLELLIVFRHRYQNLDGAVTALTRQAFTLHPPLEETYNQHVQKNDLLANWEETRQIVVSSQFKEICMNISEVDRRAFGFAWFQVSCRTSAVYICCPLEFFSRKI